MGRCNNGQVNTETQRHGAINNEQLKTLCFCVSVFLIMRHSLLFCSAFVIKKRKSC